ncbi:hypothetical protein N0B51_14295 [Tsuneonella sp. YG55]|uniref:Uncharacterized protein n=1 Tax=Tsuneonella litorea TaxID=2976475 RepID=A0A9X2W364_9SPHN|nr:hypothetical protein [Tsuneonella litorea]MCT2560150.1 hypothetical protein [Tsuneonella litorea]
MAGRPPTLVTQDEAPISPLGGTRAQAVQRLQVGVSLLLGIVLIVGLANVIEDRAKQSDDAAVPQAAATVEPSPATTANDPLADAGVVPDLPAEAKPNPSAPAVQDLEPDDGP